MPKYKVFTEFGVDSPGTRNARRIDALVAETLTTEHPRQIKLHGIEIKVSRSDLLHDEKMAEYTQYVDDFWIAIPQYLVDDAVALALQSGALGPLIKISWKWFEVLRRTLNMVYLEKIRYPKSYIN